MFEACQVVHEYVGIGRVAVARVEAAMLRKALGDGLRDGCRVHFSEIGCRMFTLPGTVDLKKERSRERMGPRVCKNSDANQVVHPARGAIDAVESRCQKANHPSGASSPRGFHKSEF